MDYSRANFAHNFLNAVETDHSVAWDVFANELNEIIHANPSAVASVLSSAGVRTGISPSNDKLSQLVFENIYKNDGLRKKITELVFLRHKTDDYITSRSGKYDQVFNNAAGTVDSTDDTDTLQVEAVETGLSRMVGVAENKNGLPVKMEMARQIMKENMRAKSRYYSMISGKIRVHPAVKVAGAIAIGALIIYGAHLIFSKPKQ